MEESTTIKCTRSCGFQVTGTEDYCNKMYTVHKHQNWSSWSRFMFSWEGVAIVFVVMYGLSVIFK